METINELFFKELENSGVSKVTIKNYKSDLKNFFSWFIDVLQSKGVNANSPQESLPFVESDTVKSYKNYLESISSSASTINRRLSALRKFGTFLNDTRATESNLFESVANVTKDDLVDKKTLILEKYLQKLESSKISTNTIKNYKADINQFLGWSEKNLNINFSDVQSINRINSESIKNYIRSSLVGASPSTIDRKLSSLKSFFSYLVDSNMAKNNPATNLINKTRGSKLLITPPARVVIDEKGSGTKESITALFAGNILAQRILNNLFNKRPKWFRRYQSTPISQYINLSLLFIIVAALAIGVYDTFFAKTTSPFAYPATPQRPNRYLSFQGRLTNQYNTPLTTAHSVTFKLWDHATNATEVSCDGGGDEDCLWTSQTCTVTPDQDGIFNVLLGTTSGDGYTCSSATEITSDVFSENSEVWLGITVETETMTSRVQIATVAYALNAETLQGFPIDASGSATKSTVVTMNQYGGIVLGEVGPRIRSVAGDFTIEGQTLNLQTAIGGNGNINLSPDGTGSVNITSSAQSDDALYVLNAQTTSGAVIHGYYSGAGTTQNLIRLGSGASETDRFWVTSNGIGYLSGRLGIGVTAPTQQLHVAGNMRLTGLLYDYNNETGSDGQILSKISGGVDWIDPSSLSIPAAGGWTDDGDIVRLTTVGNRVGIGTTSVHASTKLGILGGVAIGSQTYSDAQAPTNGFIVEGNVGIGLTNPSYKLDISPSSTNALNIAQISTNGQIALNYTVSAGTDNFSVYGIKSTAGVGTGVADGRNAYAMYNSVSNNISTGSIMNNAYGLYNLLDSSTNSADYKSIYGVSNVTTGTSGNGSTIYGLKNTILGLSGSLSSAYGTDTTISTNNSDGVAQTVIGNNVQISSSGSTDTFYGFRVVDGNITAGIAFGMYIDIDDVDWTTKYSLYVESGSANSYFGSDVGIGITNPTYALDVGNSGNVRIDGLSASSAVYTTSGKVLTTTAPTSGTLGFWQRNGTTLTAATATDNLTVGSTTNTSAILYVPGSTNNNAWFNLGTGKLGIGLTNPGAQLHVGTGASNHSLGTSDLFVTGDLEVNGAIYVDDGLYDTDGTKTLSFNADEDTTLAGDLLVADNFFVGTTTENIANTGFTMDGNDGFVEGHLGIGGTVYSNGGFIVGASTYYGNGTIIQSSGETLTLGTTSANLTLQTTTSGSIVLTSAENIIDINSTSVDLASQATNFNLINTTVGALTFESSLLTLDTSNSRVGIGITNPLANLHIYDSTTDGSSIIRLQNDAQSWQLATAGSASDYFILRNVTGSTDVMRIAPNSGAQSIEITSTGVGIGKVPGYKLDVNGAANFGGALTGITTITTSSTINSQTISSAASFTGTLYSAGKITSGANNAAYFRGGDDAEFFDINVANTTAIYGIQNSAVASLKLGSGGGTLSGYGGNIGIGYTTPGGQLEVRNTTAGKVTLDIQHASTTLSQYYAVASFTTRSAEASDRYLIYAGRLDSGGGFVDGEFRVNTNGAAYADGGWNGAADFAEYFNTDDTSLDKGEIVSLVPGVNKKVKRANNQNVGIFGVVSTQPGFVGAPVNDITEDINEIENNPNWKIVGVLGQVPTYVNNENGEIKAGDPITLSSQPGIGAKSNGEGQIVGRAMEGYNSSTPGKIMVLVQPTWYDPDVALSADGSIQIINQDDNSFIVEYSNGQKANRIASFAKVFTANINAGFTVTKELVVKNSASFMGTVTAGAIEAGNITAQGFNIFQGSVDNLLVRAGLVSPTIQTGLISPLADENEIRFQVGEGGKLAVNNANGDEVASISDTGEIKGSSVKTYNANVTGELRAQRIIASEILDENGNPINQNDITLEDIETLLAAAETDQQMLTDSGNWNINTTDGSASITDLSVENLFVTGNAAMSSLSLTTSLTVGSDLVIASSVNEAGLAVNNIDTLSSPLKIQALALAPVEIMSGLFKINTNGNVEITGNLYVAGRVNSKGITLNENSESGENLLSVLDKDGLEKASVTASGSATFNDVKAGKLIVAGSTTEVKIANENGVVETNSPVGQARIVEGEIEVAIINVNVTENTLVYVTPVGSTQNKVLFVKSKEPGKFTVGISSPATKDIDFNWWVVETSN